MNRKVIALLLFNILGVVLILHVTRDRRPPFFPVSLGTCINGMTLSPETMCTATFYFTPTTIDTCAQPVKDKPCAMVIYKGNQGDQ
jgi:hypothetical protein